MKIASLYFFVNASKADGVETHARLAASLARHGIAEAGSPDGADAVVALGGDGTILRAVRSCMEKPIVGFNIGSLGYLASVERKDFDGALAMLAEGRFRISRRTMLAARKAGSGETCTALNDIAITKVLSGHVATMDLAVNSRTAARYTADGMVFATPTGSTAYSLAAGGPVVMPDSPSFVVTPVNPHALGTRPMVVSDSVSMQVALADRGEGSKAGVYADGENAFFLDPGETVEICRAPCCASLIELEGYDPYDVMARKLGWNGFAKV